MQCTAVWLLGPVVVCAQGLLVLTLLGLLVGALVLLPGWCTAPLSGLLGWRLGLHHGQQRQSLTQRTTQMHAGMRTTEV